MTSAKPLCTVVSLQPVAVWEQLCWEGELAADPTRNSTRHDLLDPETYRWMREQTHRRVGRGDSVQWPWWAWKAPMRRRILRSCVKHSPEKLVAITLALPPDKVLFSNFVTWEMVMNNGYVAVTQEEQDRWDKAEEERNALGIHPGERPLPEPWQREVEKSWENIFRIRDLQKGDYGRT